MSRVGKKPVPLLKGVQATVDGQTVKVKGPKGELQATVHDLVAVELTGEGLVVTPRNETKLARALWGTWRANLMNLNKGVSTGFQRNLEINGVGYKAAMKGKDLQLSLGYSHEVLYSPPAGVTVACPKPTEIVITGIDKQKVGQTAAQIREYRGPEPFKGKGVKYSDEFIFRKEGKKK